MQFAELRRVLLLALKYRLHDIVGSGFARLEQVFAADYNDWRMFLKEQDIFHYGVEHPVHMAVTDAVAVVCLARAAGHTRILPTALYVCATLDPQIILDGVGYESEFQVARLSKADQRTCFASHRKLRSIGLTFHEAFLKEVIDGSSPPCTTPEHCQAVYRRLVLEVEKLDEVFDVRCFTWNHWFDRLDHVDKPSRCIQCSESLATTIQHRAEEAWAQLGDIFDIPEWVSQKNLTTEFS